MSDLASKVARGVAIKREQAALKAELDAIQAELMAAGPGEYSGTIGEKAKVVAPFKKFAPDAESIEQARELVGDDVFKKIFTRSIVWTAVKSARHVAAALLTPAKLTKLVDLCEVDASGFVMWPK